MKTTIILFVALCISTFANIKLFLNGQSEREHTKRWAELALLQAKEITAWSFYTSSLIDHDSLMVINKITSSYVDSFSVWIADK